ncbi:DNA mismatch repair protein MSH4, partial [Cucurbita argyrosperma subsp. sororia]
MEDDGGERSSYVIGLIENRAKEVGVAAFDLRSASLHLSQYIETSSSYQNTKTLLHFYDPMVILVPPNKLAPDGMVGVSVLVDRFYVTVKKGAVLIKNLAAKEPSALGLETYYKQYYLCLAAAAASIKWIEAEKGVIVTNHSLTVTFNGSSDHVSIDATRSRLLRANLLQPLKDIETINARLDCLDELMSNEQLFFGLSQALRKFPKETDRVLCHFCFKQKKVTNEVLGADNAKKSQSLISSIILLKTSLEALPLLSKVLKEAKNFLLANIYNSVCENEKFATIRRRIGEVIDEDVLHARVPFIARTQQCFAVKAGIDGLLDIARRTFCDTSEGYSPANPLIRLVKHLCYVLLSIHNLANKYREEYKLPNLKLPFNNRQGFYLSIPRKDVQGKLPSKFIQVLKHGNNIRFSTLELASLNVRNKSAAGECYIRTEICLEGLVDAIREDVSMLTLLAEVLCLLDMMVNSFAHTISSKPVDRYTRPNFTESGPMAIEAARHPILESIHNDFVVRLNSLTITDSCNANSIFLSEASNMIIVMGPNMSLVVVDELGRATSSSDGFAIAWSCCEYLLSLKAYTIFATHMDGLSELVTIYPNVKILHFHVDIRNNRLDFKFQLKDGIRHVPHYGLLLAEVAGLPSSVIETARNITSRILEKEERRMEINYLQYHPIRMAYNVAQRLICLKHSSHDEDSIREALQNLKEGYINGRL